MTCLNGDEPEGNSAVSQNYDESAFVEYSWRELAACGLLPEPLGLAQRVAPLPLYCCLCDSPLG